MIELVFACDDYSSVKLASCVYDLPSHMRRPKATPLELLNEMRADDVVFAP